MWMHIYAHKTTSTNRSVAKDGNQFASRELNIWCVYFFLLSHFVVVHIFSIRGCHPLLSSQICITHWLTVCVYSAFSYFFLFHLIAFYFANTRNVFFFCTHWIQHTAKRAKSILDDKKKYVHTTTTNNLFCNRKNYLS